MVDLAASLEAFEGDIDRWHRKNSCETWFEQHPEILNVLRPKLAAYVGGDFHVNLALLRRWIMTPAPKGAGASFPYTVRAFTAYVGRGRWRNG